MPTLKHRQAPKLHDCPVCGEEAVFSTGFDGSEGYVCANPDCGFEDEVEEYDLNEVDNYED